jgi:hypothetical protein
VDPSFGNRLADLPIGEPAWVVGSRCNRPIIQQLWRERHADSHLTGITQFDPHGATAEEILLNELDTIDLHHGRYSSDPPWSAAIVYGATPTADLAQAFATIGFATLTPTADGFIARWTEIST